ncbi:pyruvate dehydrogenase E1 component alpha subunit [Labedella gwakjiensis]|uniref:2-oxoisovalerate dehydrogenase subunit alpha n=1 Tax=Labedella gwakjiensis TaxID=390269 RepID=A0A2P8GTC4_9MICO|nr:thiamine pyrophosphate-dependent dehydrogenase E1 component subunit alpha [Labedella gwakjiensis]PSL37226.1 pyruvate dehydrogenase E1 component alpha subunit [Labedella gwakjiensis]RUQ84561.1 thiamine pyrophosphate-dependent dehydrogenase E1 component subunit alpha [Labedella gwakjiensis]
MTDLTETTTVPTPVQFIAPDGTFAPNAGAEEYGDIVAGLDDATLQRMFHDMTVVRAFDVEAGNLQRQGQLALWVPSHGQEAAQVGSAYATRPQDHVFPSYREHAVGFVRGIDLMNVVRLLRGVTHGGWDPKDPRNGNFHLYTLVIGSQALHATGYAMGIALDGASGTGDLESDQAAIVYFGDGATSQGDVSEAFVFAASYQTPQVFFLQNNHWAISVPVTRQSRTPLFKRGTGFGIPSVQIDGNDVLASYAVTAKNLDEARAGGGPRLVEALTYRIGAHTTSDDPTKYRTDDELASWVARDPIARFQTYLRSRGADDAFFAEVAAQAKDYAADTRRRTLALESPPADLMFENVYTDEHPLTAEQFEWLERYEESLEGGDAR